MYTLYRVHSILRCFYYPDHHIAFVAVLHNQKKKKKKGVQLTKKEVIVFRKSSQIGNCYIAGFVFSYIASSPRFFFFISSPAHNLIYCEVRFNTKKIMMGRKLSIDVLNNPVLDMVCPLQ